MKVQHLRRAVLAGDVLCVLGAWGLAVALRYAGMNLSTEFTAFAERYSHFLLGAVVTWIPLYFGMKLDGFRGGWHFPAIVSKLIVGVTCMMLVLFAFAFATRDLYSRLVLFYFSALFFVGTIAIRCVARAFVATHLNNLAANRCVIVGRGAIARELANKIAAHPEFPFQIVGYLYPGLPDGSNGFPGASGAAHIPMKTLGVPGLLTRETVQKLIIATPASNGVEMRKLVDQCRKASIEVYLVPELYDLYLSKAELTEIDGLPLVSLREHTPRRLGFALKRALDISFSVAILLLLSPIFALAALFVYAKKGRAFRTEPRCGQDGVQFEMYRLNIDRHGVNPLAYEKLFVRWSLTELPQLWNVLRGDMSLVGPRPESPERTKHYSEWQRQRLKVRAGVTGLAQVHGLRDQHPSEDKTRFDLQYISNWSPFLDLSIIVQTVWTLLSRGLVQDPNPADDSIFQEKREKGKDEVVIGEAAGANRS